MLRYLLAILAGFVLWTILFLGGNAVLAALVPSAFNEDGSTSSSMLLIVLLLLTVIYSVLSGITTARIAQAHQVRCGLVLGLLLLLVGIGVQLQFWDIIPLWYNLAFLALLVPGAWFGARLAST